MGNLILTSQYGQSITSEEATATLNDVVKGKTALTSDSDDNLGIGTLELTGNTNPAHVLISNTFYTTDPHTKQIGTMPNHPAQNATLTCGQSKTLPAGYIPGGTITAATLASQTGGATATDAYVRSGYTYWKDGVKRTGAMTVSSVVSFSAAAYSTSQILCTWKNPAKGPYSGVAICAKTGGYPTNINDSRKYTGVGNNSVLNGISTVIISGLTAGTTYYFRIWVYCTCSAGDLYSGYLQASCAPTAHGRKAFTSSGVFTVPANVRSIDIHCTGGGARGGTGTREASGDYDSGGGGGGGYTAYKKGIAVTPGSVIDIIVGRGGWLSYNSADYNTTGEGGRSSASRSGIELCAATGGMRKGSGAYPNACGGHGGSGGGGGTTDSYKSSYGYAGGSDGGDGNKSWTGNTHSYSNGKGQGTTTREFGEASATLYSGGGGAGSPRTPAAPGGAGGGGTGGTKSGAIIPVAGTPGTGGGGGGGGYCSTSFSGTKPANYIGANGGSGNVIIRW